MYDNFSFVVNGEKINEFQPSSGNIEKKINLNPGESKTVEISYVSQGMDAWWYVFGYDVSRVQNFKLTMITDFDQIDFPVYTI